MGRKEMEGTIKGGEEKEKEERERERERKGREK